MRRQRPCGIFGFSLPTRRTAEAVPSPSLLSEHVMPEVCDLFSVRTYECFRINSECVSKPDEFGEIQSAFPSLNLRYETLRFSEPFRHFDLRQPRFLPCLDQQAAEHFILRTVKGIRHPQEANNPTWNIPDRVITVSLVRKHRQSCFPKGLS